ncbi:MAG: nucleotidyltransferase domain-containing protein [Candidatus Aminicenantes bacterium]|nr:nucleotidyltransferase domain-containing protein [Candidatus Aminicenantes bacterium]
MKNFEIINRLFSSKIRVKLLDAFLSFPKVRFYTRELERRINEEAKNISRELKNLENLGLLTSEKIGNQKHYSANEDFFLYSELKGIIFKTTGVLGLLKEALAKIKGIEAALIYGSYATGKESESSDVDLMIIGKPDLTELNEEIGLLEDRLNREINYICFDRTEYENRKKAKDAFISDISAEKQILLKGSENEI